MRNPRVAAQRPIDGGGRDRHGVYR